MISRKRKVMICVPCLMVGGTEIHTLLLAKALISGGYEATVCVYFEHDPIMLAEFERNGIRVILLSLQRQTRARNLTKMPELLFALIKLMREGRPQFVHAQYMAPGFAPLLAARLAEVSVVIATVHVTANHYGKRRWLPRNVASALCDVFLCVSHTAEASFFGESAAQFSGELYDAGRRHFTIHNGVDLDAIDEVIAERSQASLRRSLGLEGRPVVGIVGRLDRFKGHDFLLRAMAIVQDRVPDVALLCVGGGGDLEKLEAQAKSLGIADRVIFTGPLPQRDVFRHIQLMDVVAMPSRIGLEGFGLTAAEAMAMGRPLIASRADALTEVVGEDGVAGLLVEPGDVPALAAGIEHLLNDPGERGRLGAAARARVEEKFSMALFAQRHLNLYEALCGGRTKSMDANRLAVGGAA